MTFDTATFWSAFGVLAAISISFIGIRAQQDGLIQAKSSRRRRHEGAYRKLVGVFVIAVSASGLLAFAFTASGIPKTIKEEVQKVEMLSVSNDTPVSIDDGPDGIPRQGTEGADPAISPSAVIPDLGEDSGRAHADERQSSTSARSCECDTDSAAADDAAAQGP